MLIRILGVSVDTEHVFTGRLQYLVLELQREFWNVRIAINLADHCFGQF